MATTPRNNEDDKPLRIRRGRVESVDLYEIKDSELELFRKGSPADLQLNFAIFLLSLSFASIVALSTSTFPDKDIRTAFIVVVVVGILMGAYLLISWARNRTSLTSTCDRIRERIKDPDLIIRETTETASRLEITSVDPNEPSEAKN